MRRCFLLATTILFCWTSAAMAHPGHGEHSLSAGVLHPLTGLDHLLAMVAVGLLAVRFAGHRLWVLPSLFLGGMVLGGTLAGLGVTLPAVEPTIAVSVLVLGLLIAWSKQLPLVYCGGLVAFFALFHGHAHIAEMSAGSSAWMYSLGMLLSTAVLHGCGVLGGWALSQGTDRSSSLRWLGGMISAAGVCLICGWL